MHRTSLGDGTANGSVTTSYEEFAEQIILTGHCSVVNGLTSNKDKPSIVITGPSLGKFLYLVSTYFIYLFL